MSDKSNITGVILAAGKGSRISQLPTRKPKVILPVMGEPIIYHQLKVMSDFGIKNVLIVVGHLGFEVVREIERLPSLGLHIDYIEQNETLGIAHCVNGLEAHIDGPFMLFLGDIYFNAPQIGQMLETFKQDDIDAVLGAIEEDDSAALRKNFCILTNDDGSVRRVIEKPRHPTSNLKGVGVYMFSASFFDSLRRTPRTAMRNEYEITDSIQIFVDDGYKVVPCMCIEEDLNVTFPKDLLAINMQLLQDRNVDNYIGSDITKGKNVRIENSVIGPGVKIADNTTICNSVVFSEAAVESGEYNGVIITEQAVFRP